MPLSEREKRLSTLRQLARKMEQVLEHVAGLFRCFVFFFLLGGLQSSS